MVWFLPSYLAGQLDLEQWLLQIRENSDRKPGESWIAPRHRFKAAATGVIGSASSPSVFQVIFLVSYGQTSCTEGKSSHLPLGSSWKTDPSNLVIHVFSQNQLDFIRWNPIFSSLKTQCLLFFYLLELKTECILWRSSCDLSASIIFIKNSEAIKIHSILLRDMLTQSL